MERCSKELQVFEDVAKEILEKQKEEKLKSSLTNPSALALNTTKHSSGERQ